MQQPVDVLLAQPDWVIGAYADIFEQRAAEREAADQKRKQSTPSQAARPPGRRRRR